jgi:hypothetical protein
VYILVLLAKIKYLPVLPVLKEIIEMERIVPVMMDFMTMDQPVKLVIQNVILV